MKKCVLFDLDGVVINSEPLYEKATVLLMQKYNIIISSADWKHLHGLSEQDFYRACIDLYQIDSSVSKLIEQGNNLVLDVFKNCDIPFNNGFLTLFQELDSFYDLALVTATSEKIFNVINTKLKISRYFSTIVFGGITKKNKPAPDPYLYAMKKLNQIPKNCVIIEDSLPGIQSARATKSKVIALGSTIGCESLPDFVDIKASSLTEITKKTIDMLLNR